MREGTQGRNLDAGTEAQTMEKRCLLHWFSDHGLLTQLPCKAQGHLARGALWNCPQYLSSPHQTLTEKMPYIYSLNANMLEMFFSTEVILLCFQKQKQK